MMVLRKLLIYSKSCYAPAVGPCTDKVGAGCGRALPTFLPPRSLPPAPSRKDSCSLASKGQKASSSLHLRWGHRSAYVASSALRQYAERPSIYPQ